MNKLRKIHALAIAAFAAIAFAFGCASLDTGDPRVLIHPSAASIAQVVSITYEDANPNAKGVQIVVKNKKDSYQKFKYKIIWFENGKEYKSLLSNWQDLSMHGYELKNISATAPNGKVNSFRVEIR